MAQEVKFEFDLDMSRFNRGMDTALRSVRSLDAQMKEAIKTGKSLGDSLGTFAIKIDTSDIDRAEGKLKGIDTSPEVTIGVDFSNLDKVSSRLTAMDGMTPLINVQVDATALDRIDTRVAAIDGASPDVSVAFDASGLTRIEDAVDTLDDSIRTNVDISVGGDTEMLSVLEDLRTQGTISIAIQLAGTARNALENIPLLGAVQDSGAAERLLQARTVGTDQGDIDAINEAYSNNFGETREEIASVGAAVHQAGYDIENDLLPVLEAAGSQGLDVMETFQTMDRMVASGLAPTMRDAANIIVTGMQLGGDRANDLLDTLKEYGPQFTAAGVDAEKALGFLLSGLDEGAFNTDFVADMFKEPMIRLEEALADPESSPAKALQRLFSPEEMAEFGNMTGDAYMEAVVARVQEKGTGFDLFEIFGTKAEDLTVPVVEKITFNEIEIPDDAASAASATFYDTLGSDLTGLLRTFETEVLATFEVAGQSIEDWVDGAQTKIQTLGSLIRDGMGLPEALEIALEAQGLAKNIRDFEASVGNFVIELQLVVAGVLEAMGQGDAGANIRTAVADQAANQLEYEVKFSGGEEEIAASIQRAIDRGVTPEAIAASFEELTLELIDEDQLKRAETLILQAERAISQMTVAGDSPTMPINGVDVNMFPEDLWDKMTADAPTLAIDLGAASTALDEVKASTDDSVGSAETAAPIFTTMWEALKNNSFWADETEAATSRMGDQVILTAGEIDTLEGSTSTLVESLEDLEEGGPAALSAIVDNIDENGDGIISWMERFNAQLDRAIEKAALAAENVRILNEAGGGGGGAFEETENRWTGGDVIAGSAYKVGERGEELFVPGMDGAIIPNGLTQILTGMGSSSTVTNNYVTLNATINAQGMSGAASAGRSTADRMRGMF
jgi:PAS domain-containing protein